MDDLELRMSELETQMEEIEKENGRLSAALSRAEETLKTAVQALDAMQDTHRSICESHKELMFGLRGVQRMLTDMAERTEQLDDFADTTEERCTSLEKELRTLSGDVDKMYEDMNYLAEETRRRWRQMREKLERWLWNQEDPDGMDPDDPDDVDDWPEDF